MNCEDLNRIIHELADYQPMEAALRQASISHLALCADCAAKLATTRAISNGLVLAAGMEREEAPARIKANLLEAFAQTQKSQGTATTVVDVTGRRKLRWRTGAAAAVAAAILLLVVVPLWLRRAPIGGKPSIDSSMVASKKAGESVALPPKKADEIVQVQEHPVKPKSIAKRIAHRVNPASGTESSGKIGSATIANNSEFVPLTYLAKETAVDSGMIVRVELSRSALARLGLPVTNQDTTASIKAEVVVGDDGVARAIRLVQ